MDAAIRAAVIALVVCAAVLVAAAILKGRHDRKRALTLKDTDAKMGAAQVGPAPVKAASATPGSTEVSTKDKSIRSRFLALGGLVAAALSVLGVRLWSMQLVSTEEYEKQAEENRTTTVTTTAIRGRILDRNGVELVGNRAVLTVTASADVANDRNVVHRLSNVLGIPRTAVVSRINDTAEGAQAMRVVANDVPMRSAAYIQEHATAFTGVSVETRTVRTYPNGTLAAHVLGYTGTISEEELAGNTLVDGNTYQSGDIVGKSGVEAAYESVLQGVRGTRTVEVDAHGNVVSTVDATDARNGNDVRLTLDYDAQVAAEQSLDQLLTAAHEKGAIADGAAVVGIDLHDGGVVCMASYPTFDPAQFIGGIPAETWDYLSSAASGYPLTNRAIAGLYPAASTFKSYAAMAGLKYGIATDSSSWNCSGTWLWGKKCWTSHGWLDLIHGIRYSCDIVFYNISYDFYNQSDTLGDDALQKDVMSWGLGSKTGIDIGGEAAGRIPTAQWKREYNADSPEESTWLPGDMANLVIGQGDVLISPIQNAVGYGGIATGKRLKPHLLLDVLSDSGSPVITTAPSFNDVQPEFAEEHIELVREGLRQQVTDNGWINTLGAENAGKTGTGQVYGKEDLSWYVGYAPLDDPRYVVACLVEQHGGPYSPAMVVRDALAALLEVPSGATAETGGAV